VLLQICVWGRLIGFVIALLYFGAMNSKLFKGQTLGKKILNLRVVDSSNYPITLGRSIFRYIVLATPFLLNGINIPVEAFQSFLMYPLSMVIFGGVFSILYLYAFNRATRQSLHDLAVGSFVVNAEVEKQDVAKIWMPRHVVVGVLCSLE